MTKTRKYARPTVLSICLLVVLALVATSIVLMSPMKKSYGLELPGEFKAPTGTIPTETFTTGDLRVGKNYNIGSEIRTSASDSTLLAVEMGRVITGTSGNDFTFRNLTVAEIDSAHAASQVYHRGTDDKDDIDVGGWAGWKNTDTNAREVYNGKFDIPGKGGDAGFKAHMRAAYKEYYENGIRDGLGSGAGGAYEDGEFNIGTSIGQINQWDGVIVKQDYWYGGLDSYIDNGKVNFAMLTYSINPAFCNNETASKTEKGNFYVMFGDILKKWETNKAGYGMPVTNPELVSALKTDGLTLPASFQSTDIVQVFEGGIIKKDGTALTGEYNWETKTFAEPTGWEVNPGVWGDLGTRTETARKIVGDYEHHFYNYEKGSAYVYVKTSDRAQSGKQVLAGLKFDIATVADSTMAAKTSELTFADVRTIAATFIDLSARFGVKHDNGEENNVNNFLKPYDKTIDDTYAAFKAKYEELKLAGINPGYPTTGVKHWDKNVIQELTLGDSTIARDSRQGYGWLAYNAQSGKVLYIKNEFINKIANGGQADREKAGFFLSDSNKVVTLATGGTKTVLLGEKGYFVLNGGNVDFVEGMTYDEDSQSFRGVLSFRIADYGKLVGEAYTHTDGYIYQNMTNAFVKYKYTGDKYEYIYKVNHNFTIDSGAIKTTAVAQSIYLEDFDTNVIFVSSGNDDVNNGIPGLRDNAARMATIKTSFKNALIDAIEGQGFGIGLRMSSIKHWNGIILIEFKFGEGEFYHDGSPTSGRSKMSLLVLDPDTDKVYLVGKHSYVYGNGAMTTLGAPVTNNKLTDTVKISGKTTTLNNVQYFKAGYVYIDNNNVTKTVTGYSYIPGQGGAMAELVITPAPTVPGAFGAETGRVKSGNDYYINYGKGCIKATASPSGQSYHYTKYYGRNFDSADGNKLKVMGIDSIIKRDRFLLKADVPVGKTKEEIEQKFYDAYKYWAIEKNVVLGEIDYNSDLGSIKGWSTINYIAQFNAGDSWADPFGDSRSNIGALAYNVEKDEVYLMIDGALSYYGANNDNAGRMGAPIENPVYHVANNIWTQRYSVKSGRGDDAGNNYVVWNNQGGGLILHTTLAYDKYIENIYKGGATHGKDFEKGYVGIGDVKIDKLNLSSSIAVATAAMTVAGISSTLSMLSIGAFMATDKKKIGSLFRRMK